METHPPKLIEAIVERLVPPACREHVLGDLSERYKSAGQYIADALAIIPLVIASRVRRTFDIQLFLAQAAALYISYAGASLVLGPGYLYDDSKLVPLAIVIGVALSVLVLCEAYSQPGPDARAFLFIWFSQLVIGNLKSEWTLPILVNVDRKPRQFADVVRRAQALSNCPAKSGRIGGRREDVARRAAPEIGNGP